MVAEDGESCPHRSFMPGRVPWFHLYNIPTVCNRKVYKYMSQLASSQNAVVSRLNLSEGRSVGSHEQGAVWNDRSVLYSGLNA